MRPCMSALGAFWKALRARVIVSFVAFFMLALAMSLIPLVVQLEYVNIGKISTQLVHLKDDHGFFAVFSLSLLMHFLFYALSHVLPCGFCDALQHGWSSLRCVSLQPRCLCRARRIGLRRYRARRARHQTFFQLKTIRLVLLVMFVPSLLFTQQIAWSLPSRERNRYMHMLNGNGKGGRGKGFGKSKKGAPVDTASVDAAEAERLFRESVRQALPEQARYRAQSSLLADEWSVPIVPHQQLGPGGGVCLCPREFLPQVLQQVGHTSRPTGILLVQNPDSFGLTSYPRALVTCSLSVASAGCEREIVQVQRYLVQLGFGSPVQRQVQGTEVHLDVHMRRMSAKFSTHRGWAPTEYPGNILVSHLSQYISDFAIDQVQPRVNGSFSFLCHSNKVDTLLKASGSEGIFIKQLDCEEAMELIWLQPECTLDEALVLARNDTVYGLAEKGKSGMLALRFRDGKAASAFATTHQLPDTTAVARWKISGVPSTSGLHGLYDLLHSRKWQGVDVVFMDDRHAIFHATTMGDPSSLYYNQQGQAHPIQFKALNALAKAAAKERATQARSQPAASQASTAAAPAPKRQAQQKEFLKQVMAEDKADVLMASPRQQADKRRPDGRTGETPEAKK